MNCCVIRRKSDSSDRVLQFAASYDLRDHIGECSMINGVELVPMMRVSKCDGPLYSYQDIMHFVFEWGDGLMYISLKIGPRISSITVFKFFCCFGEHSMNLTEPIDSAMNRP